MVPVLDGVSRRCREEVRKMSRKNALFILNELFEDDNLPYQVTTKICRAIEELEEPEIDVGRARRDLRQLYGWAARQMLADIEMQRCCRD